MESRPPGNVKSEGVKANSPGGNVPATDGGAVTGAGAGGGVRRFPRPPGFIPRFVMLCLRPESWAEAARYPTYVTLIPLALMIVLGCVAVATGQTLRQLEHLRTFAASYDKHYPALEMASDGSLKATGDLNGPIRVPALWGEVLVDPTGKTSVDVVKSSNVVGVITQQEIVMIGADGMPTKRKVSEVFGGPYTVMALPPAGKTKLINGEMMLSYLDRHRAEAFFLGAGGVAQMVGECVWAMLMLFMLSPLIMLAAAGPRLNPEGPDRRLILPKRAAYRMGAALLMPLVLISAILRATGHPVFDLLGMQGAMLFWFFSAAGLAVWTGIMARKMYLPKDPRRAG